jgi:acetyl esterase/lipase
MASNTASGVALVRDVEYGRAGGRRLLLDILRPDPLPDRPMPIAMEVHGGGWAVGEKDAERNRLLAENGFLTVSIDYRHTDEAIFPAQIEDCRAALRWLRSHAGEHHADAGAVGVWGASAGGHLAALLGVTGRGDEAVQAVADVCGPVDLLDLSGWHPEAVKAVEALLGGPVRERQEAARAASAIYHLDGPVPPFLLLHGEGDDVVPFRQAIRMREALEQRGQAAEVVPYPGAPHSLDGCWDDIARRIVAFFMRHLARARRA